MITACIISFTVGAMLMMFAMAMAAMAKEREPRNKVHFYLVKTSSMTFNLFLGYPSKVINSSGIWWIGNRIYVDNLKDYRINLSDYNNLEYDKPVEVFLNLEN